MSKFTKLRKKMDGNDPFATSGHQIVKVRSSKTKKIPKWADDVVQIRQIILRSVPKLATDSKQRTGAARWALMIQLYYKMNYTHSQIVAELNEQPDGKVVTLSGVRSIIRSIKRVAEGRRADGTGMLGKPKTGRKKRTCL